VRIPNSQPPTPNSQGPQPRTWYRVSGLCLAVFTIALTASFGRASAQQSRSAGDGVYTVAQAARGEVLYRMQCGLCHGETLGGDIGPPLSGDMFLAIWGPMTASELFDKIQNTMPADSPGTLSRPQTADLVAYLLKGNAFPAGAADLSPVDAALKQIALGGAARTAAPAQAGAAGMSFPAAGTLNQLMRGVLFPSSNVLFDVQTQDPGARKAGARPEAGTTTARYGDVYEPWQVVDAAAIAIAESGPTLMTPGRRCENGKPVPVDRADWQQYVQGLVAAGRAAYKASQSRNVETVSAVTNDVSDACANCHRVYRDVASAAMRCMAPQ
jgi:mono/diheme cytochrome c family protein